MPACAPLAVPYVPFQQRGSQKYNQADALANGTVFPGLNLPFHMKAEAAGLPDNHSTQLQALLFVVTELGLYLDTHQDDAEAFQLFKQYTTMAREAKQRYEEMHGPLTQMSAGQDAAYRWLDDPWPWEFKKNEGA
ncbi:MAG: spore coat associated protein CotJA [Oscillospiraceae bacterium]|jgi:spore coat protein JB|nr:spore coat associated protein CotJA [Oscillospiraceae bacterium]